MLENRPESPIRLLGSAPTLNRRVHLQCTQGADGNKDMNIFHIRLSIWGPDSHTVDILETDEGNGVTTVHNTEGERTSDPPPNIELTSTHEDRPDGQMELLGTCTKHPESKMTSLRRRQSLDNYSDEETQKDGVRRLLLPIRKVKILKKERDEPASRIRNRSKRKDRNTNK